MVPHLADGGGWTTQLILINPSDETIAGTIDFYNQGNAGTASAMTLNLDGQIRSSYSYSIPARSSRRVTTLGAGSQIQVGSAQVTPDASNAAPVGVAVFSFKSNGVTVSEAGVPSLEPGNAFRLYIEEAAGRTTRSGVAVMNSNESQTRVQFELTQMDGTFTGLSGSILIPARGQRALFLDEIPGFEALPAPFKGIVRIYSADETDIAVMGLRGRSNERGDFLLTTTAPNNELHPSATQIVFPHVVDGAGYTTQFVLYSGTAGEPASGNLNLFSQTGGSLSLGLQ